MCNGKIYDAFTHSLISKLYHALRETPLRCQSHRSENSTMIKKMHKTSTGQRVRILIRFLLPTGKGALIESCPVYRKLFFNWHRRLLFHLSCGINSINLPESSPTLRFQSTSQYSPINLLTSFKHLFWASQRRCSSSHYKIHLWECRDPKNTSKLLPQLRRTLLIIKNWKFPTLICILSGNAMFERTVEGDWMNQNSNTISPAHRPTQSFRVEKLFHRLMKISI